MKEYTKGEVYYRITFPGKDTLFPSITTFVFIGKNISVEDVIGSERWYFQFAESFATYGSALKANPDRQPVTRLEKDRLVEMLDINELQELLKNCELQRKT